MELYGFVIFTDHECSCLDYRFGGQALPAGAVPLEAEGESGARVKLHGFAEDWAFGQDTLPKVREAAREEMAAFP